MSTDKVLKIFSTSSNDTEKLGERFGKSLRGGEVLELIGDLGAGKTTFVRGLARGVGSTDTVSSPTFTISRRYTGGKFEVHHYDFYRLMEVGVTSDELEESVGFPDIVTVVEWADTVKSVLPASRVRITFHHLAEDGRSIDVEYPQELAYMVGE